MLVFEESWRMDRMLHGVRLTFKALAPSSEAFARRVSYLLGSWFVFELVTRAGGS